MQELILEEKITLSPVMKEIYRRLRTNLEKCEGMYEYIDNRGKRDGWYCPCE